MYYMIHCFGRDPSVESDKQVSFLLLHSVLSDIIEITSMIDVD